VAVVMGMAVSSSLLAHEFTRRLRGGGGGGGAALEAWSRMSFTFAVTLHVHATHADRS
jgi:hypothetical protein